MTSWPLKPLLDAADLVNSRVGAFAGVRQYVSTGDVDGTTIVRSEPVTFDGRPSRADMSAAEGDVLFARMQATDKVVVVTTETENDLWSTGFAALRPKRGTHPRWLSYWLGSKPFSERKDALCTGATQKAITNDGIRRLAIPLPPLPEQERIVRILDEAEALRRRRSQADERLSDLVATLFTNTFGDPTNLDQMRQARKAIGDFAAVSYGLSDRLDAATQPESGTRILTISNVTLDGSLDLSVQRYSTAAPRERSKARVQKWDLLFNWRNGSEEHVGKTAIWEEQIPGEVLHVSFLLKIRVDPDKAHPLFLWVLLNRLRATGFFKRNSRMQINTKFNASELSALQLPLPPLELQHTFAVRVVEVREVEAVQAVSRRQLDDLFQSLLHRAFQGEL